MSHKINKAFAVGGVAPVFFPFPRGRPVPFHVVIFLPFFHDRDSKVTSSTRIFKEVHSFLEPQLLNKFTMLLARLAGRTAFEYPHFIHETGYKRNFSSFFKKVCEVDNNLSYVLFIHFTISLVHFILYSYFML